MKNLLSIAIVLLILFLVYSNIIETFECPTDKKLDVDMNDLSIGQGRIVIWFNEYDEMTYQSIKNLILKEQNHSTKEINKILRRGPIAARYGYKNTFCDVTGKVKELFKSIGRDPKGTGFEITNDLIGVEDPARKKKKKLSIAI